jgi:hypothetical protein
MTNEFTHKISKYYIPLDRNMKKMSIIPQNTNI